MPLVAGVRLHEKAQDQPESIQRQVLALQKVFLAVGALKPPGLMTEPLKRDWQASVLRLAQTKVAEAAFVIIQNALRTYGELHAFLTHRGRAFPPLRGSGYYSAGDDRPRPRAQCASLAAQAYTEGAWDISKLRITPELKKKSPSTKEDRIEGMCRGGDPRWTCLLGSWLVATGCVRCQNIRRSTVRRASPMSSTAIAAKASRSMPAVALIDARPLSLPQASTGPQLGLSCGRASLQWPRTALASASMGVGRLGTWLRYSIFYTFAEFLDNTEQLTSYSWRRMLPTVGHLQKCPPQIFARWGTGKTKGAGRGWDGAALLVGAIFPISSQQDLGHFSGPQL